MNTPDDSNTANFARNVTTDIGFNDGYAVNGSTTTFPISTNPFTDVGAYTAATSPYGTFDQNGNVWEWNEALVGSSFHSIRGGSWFSGSNGLAASFRSVSFPSIESFDFGFRVASIPEPSTLLLGAMASVGLLMRKRRLG